MTIRHSPIQISIITLTSTTYLLGDKLANHVVENSSVMVVCQFDLSVETREHREGSSIGHLKSTVISPIHKSFLVSITCKHCHE